MSAAVVPASDPGVVWVLPSRGRVAMAGLICAETAIFTIFVIAYLFYLGKSQSGPQPADVLHVPILLTICLLSSSGTIHFAVTALRRGERRRRGCRQAPQGCANAASRRSCTATS